MSGDFIRGRLKAPCRSVGLGAGGSFVACWGFGLRVQQFLGFRVQQFLGFRDSGLGSATGSRASFPQSSRVASAGSAQQSLALAAREIHCAGVSLPDAKP